MSRLSIKNPLLCAGTALLIGNDAIELITAISEFDPLPLLIFALGLTITKYQANIKPKVKKAKSTLW